MFESLKICMYFGEVILLSVHIKHEFFFFFASPYVTIII